MKNHFNILTLMCLLFTVNMNAQIGTINTLQANYGFNIQNADTKGINTSLEYRFGIVEEENKFYWLSLAVGYSSFSNIAELNNGSKEIFYQATAGIANRSIGLNIGIGMRDNFYFTVAPEFYPIVKKDWRLVVRGSANSLFVQEEILRAKIFLAGTIGVQYNL